MNPAIPCRFPLAVLDKVEIGFGCIGDMVIHMEMVFGHPLDPNRLRTAMTRLLDAEPVLGCRLAIGAFGASWVRLPQEERENLSIAQTRLEYEAFLRSPHLPETGPLLKGCLWSGHHGKGTSEQENEPPCDHLMLKIAHEISDAGGLKETAARLADIYNKLRQDPDWQPSPNLKGSRSIRQVLRQVPLRRYPRIYGNYLLTQARIIKSEEGHLFQQPGHCEGRPRYLTRRLSPEQTLHLRHYGQQHGVTLNDIFITVFLRAMMHLGGKKKKALSRLIFTADLRQHYLPEGRGESICNLSAIEILFIRTDPEQDFQTTLNQVSRFIKKRKQNGLGLSDLIGLAPTLSLFPTAWLRKILHAVLPWACRKSAVQSALTNLGPIHPENLIFDKAPLDARILVPPMFPPVLAAGISGYMGSLTLSMTCYGEPEQQRTAERFMERFLDELPL